MFNSFVYKPLIRNYYSRKQYRVIHTYTL